MLVSEREGASRADTEYNCDSGMKAEAKLVEQRKSLMQSIFELVRQPEYLDLKKLVSFVANLLSLWMCVTYTRCSRI